VIDAGSTSASHSTLMPETMVETSTELSLTNGTACPFVWSTVNICWMWRPASVRGRSTSGGNILRQSSIRNNEYPGGLGGGLAGGLPGGCRLQLTTASGQRCLMMPAGGALVRASTEPSVLRAVNCQ